MTHTDDDDVVVVTNDVTSLSLQLRSDNSNIDSSLHVVDTDQLTVDRTDC